MAPSIRGSSPEPQRSRPCLDRTEVGRYEEAEPLGRRALAISEKALGPEHPTVAESREQPRQGLPFPRPLRGGRTASAGGRSEIREKVLGPDRPAVSESLNSLAELYRAQGLNTQAESLGAPWALAIREKALGPDHPDVAESLENLARLYPGRPNGRKRPKSSESPGGPHPLDRGAEKDGRRGSQP
ncbi:MAG: tetratricopeptide repeat-containing protein [Candidatus Moduliflexus flocculans]|nr:tetratricopeptide repeat-containing protein [Candidatus Moduliflexus flocculans]